MFNFQLPHVFSTKIIRLFLFNKKIILIFSILVSFDIYGKSICIDKDLVNINGFFYIKNMELINDLTSQEIYSGQSICQYNNIVRMTNPITDQHNDLSRVEIMTINNGQLVSEQHSYYYDENNQKYKAYSLINGIKEGMEYFWFKSGNKMIERNYENGKIIGLEYIWNDYGNLYRMREYALTENGSYTQTRIILDDYGRKGGEEYIIDGIVTGSQDFQYYKNGSKKLKRYSNTTDYHGEYILWHRNGHKFIVGNYKDGKAHDKWTFFSTKGKKSEERNFINGELINTTIFKYSFFTGKLKTQKTN